MTGIIITSNREPLQDDVNLSWDEALLGARLKTHQYASDLQGAIFQQAFVWLRMFVTSKGGLSAYDMFSPFGWSIRSSIGYRSGAILWRFDLNNQWPTHHKTLIVRAHQG